METGIECLKRINLDTIKEAFEKSKIIPSTHLMCYCVMAAVCYPSYNLNGWMELGFDRKYIQGVMDGWDNDLRLSKIERNNLKYKLGVADGKAAAFIMELEWTQNVPK